MSPLIILGGIFVQLPDEEDSFDKQSMKETRQKETTFMILLAVAYVIGLIIVAGYVLHATTRLF